MSRADGLTPRQKEMGLFILAGNSTKEIAKIWQVSTKTAESHRSGLMKKLGAKNFAGLFAALNPGAAAHAQQRLAELELVAKIMGEYIAIVAPNAGALEQYLNWTAKHK